jgi:hypothetical protein
VDAGYRARVVEVLEAGGRQRDAVPGRERDSVGDVRGLVRTAVAQRAADRKEEGFNGVHGAPVRESVVSRVGDAQEECGGPGDVVSCVPRDFVT